tara:strand:+ start:220 stop:981 length:762 start_codon:yes stop_codon:yes gene_type:complete
MIRLGINLDHIATLRQARLTSYPSPTQASVLAELGGADNITCHLREDRRHIQDHDVSSLKEMIQIPLNFEIAATEEMLALACKLKPHFVTLVPEKRQELTTESGILLEQADLSSLASSIAQLRENRCLVSLFVDPNKEAIRISQELGAQAVELHTGDYAQEYLLARSSREQYELIKPLQEIAEYTASLGLQVHVGHGITYQNAPWLQLVPHVEEANIGHAVLAQAFFVGLKEAVREMKALLNNPIYRPLVTMN